MKEKSNLHYTICLKKTWALGSFFFFNWLKCNKYHTVLAFSVLKCLHYMTLVSKFKLCFSFLLARWEFNYFTFSCTCFEPGTGQRALQMWAHLILLATSRNSTIRRQVFQMRELGKRKVSNMPKVIQLASHSQNLNPGTLEPKVLPTAWQPASISWNLGPWSSWGLGADLAVT